MPTPSAASYAFTLVVTDDQGANSEPATVTITIDNQKPTTPTGLTATVNNTQVDLTWTAVEGADSYVLYWSNTAETGIKGTPIAVTTGTSHRHTDLTNGSTYYYVITAKNAGDESEPSIEVSATISPPLVKLPIPTATASNAQVDLSWTAVDGADSYVLYWSNTAGTGIKGTPIAVTTGTSHRHTGLTNGSTYYYVITAKNADSESEPSIEVSATPMNVPTAPTQLTAISGDSQVALSWDAVTDTDSYNVYASTTSNADLALADIVFTTTNTSYTDTNLVNGTAYYYVVTSVVQEIESEPSLEADALPNQTPFDSGLEICLLETLRPSGSIAKISDLNCIGKNISNLTGIDQLTNLSSIDFTNNNITQNLLQLANITALSSVILAGNDNIPCADLNQLANGILAVTLPSSCMPETPTSFRYKPTNGGVELGWNLVPPLSSGFNVYWNTSNDFVNDINIIEKLAGEQSHIFDFTPGDLAYYFRITALSGSNESPLSDALTISVELLVDNINFADENLKQCILNGETDVRASDVMTVSCTVAFTPTISTLGGIELLSNLSSLTISNHQLTNITLVGQLPSLTELILSNNNITAGAKTITDLNNLTRLDLFGNNEIPCNDIDTITTFADQQSNLDYRSPLGCKPNPPLSVQLDPASTSITITWNTVSKAMGYRIHWSNTGDFTEKFTPYTVIEPITFYTDRGLLSGVTYYYRLTAFNDLVESDFSSIVSAKLP